MQVFQYGIAEALQYNMLGQQCARQSVQIFHQTSRQTEVESTAGIDDYVGAGLRPGAIPLSAFTENGEEWPDVEW